MIIKNFAKKLSSIPLRIIITLTLVTIAGYAYWKYSIPMHRVENKSELVMLGDLNGDNRWTQADLDVLNDLTNNQFALSDALASRIDMNQNGLIDAEDIVFLQSLVASDGDPYSAEERARSRGESFPRPRELYRYISSAEYHPRPLYALPYPGAADSVLDWLPRLPPPGKASFYAEALQAAVYAEAIRFDQAWRKRHLQLLPIEREYAVQKLARAKSLYQAGEWYELLVLLTELVEDAETLTVRNQPEYPVKLLAFRDHLREVLGSPEYAAFKTGDQDWRGVLKLVSRHLQADLGLSYEFETLGPPRNFNSLENYLQRVEWQYYKSSTREKNLRALIAYAQHDPRYLRAVSRTSRKLQDANVNNHNLPMVLLFREALRISNGDKKRAVGMLDEAIRIPFAWIKSIPREVLPTSLALENFLLPGNKEDGADKSRHWNVFGGICLYKSPQEALDLALKREMQDLRNDKYSEEGMREFFRDMIANLNGMFHVMTVNPKLLAGISENRTN